MNARVPRAPANQSATVADQSKNPSFVSAVVSNRCVTFLFAHLKRLTLGFSIHNAYLLASAWRIVCDSLIELKADGLANDKVLDQLERSADLRNRYLVMFDMVSRLVNLSQAKFSVLATTAGKTSFSPNPRSHSLARALCPVFQDHSRRKRRKRGCL